jgi:hypothetical protein
MKKCPDCGLENPENASQCNTCHTSLLPPADLEKSEPPIDEKLLWGRMTFKQFAIFFIRLQALWLIFYTVDVATYLPNYAFRLSEYSPGTNGFMDAKMTLFFGLLRIILHGAAALALILYGEKLLSFLVKAGFATTRSSETSGLPAPEKTNESFFAATGIIASLIITCVSLC